MWAFLIGGVAPDIDFALLPFDSFNSLHRTITHNLFFVALIAAAGAACMLRRPKRDRIRFACAAFIAGLLHLLIDSVMDANGSNGVGVAILWPISARMFSPFNLLDPHMMGAGWSDRPRALAVAVRTLILESPLIAAAILLRVMRRRWTAASAAAPAPTSPHDAHSR
jgi:hypothetical protein